MKLIIGLGNPGKQYQNTRHNMGYMVLDTFFENWKTDKKSKCLISDQTTIENTNGGILGIKPETFMNLSGDTVSALVSFYKIDPKKDILVISDDIDMEFGKIRYRKEGSHGGQNGLRDIIAKLGTNEFARIKVGIGRDDRYSVSDWVLSNITPSEKNQLKKDIFPKVIEYINAWIGD
ncbi:aminoacyl-tRNA hydrolase [Candidatus Gracilibacteria bacterium]|nr:aminoacyl-tRNA hydrolase [Candidatus Gracilibacteria bacterium]